MNKLNITTIASAIALVLSTGAMAQSLSKDGYAAGKTRIEAEYKSAKAACDASSGNARNICVIEAKGQAKVAKAELEASYKPSAKASHAVVIAKADADYATAKEKCGDQKGTARKSCLKDAKAAQTLAETVAPAATPSTVSNKPVIEAPPVSTAKKESPGAYVDDAVITTKVKAAVLEESTLKSAEINVETYKGIVQLSGFVRSRADIDKAVVLAQGVKGVSSVKNDMVVKGQQ